MFGLEWQVFENHQNYHEIHSSSHFTHFIVIFRLAPSPSSIPKWLIVGPAPVGFRFVRLAKPHSSTSHVRFGLTVFEHQESRLTVLIFVFTAKEKWSLVSHTPQHPRWLSPAYHNLASTLHLSSSRTRDQWNILIISRTGIPSWTTRSVPSSSVPTASRPSPSCW